MTYGMYLHRLFLCLACCGPVATALAESPATPESANKLTFEQHIRPILREYCFDCHGAGQKNEANLDLRLVRFMEKGGDSGPAIIKATGFEDSSLLKLVSSGDMPPGEARVPAEKVELIRQWWPLVHRPRDQTGIDRTGRAYRLASKTGSTGLTSRSCSLLCPTSANCRMLNRCAPQLMFGCKQAMPEGLTLSPEAPRHKLIMRAYFDLIGLPPNQAELDRWLNESSDTWFTSMLDHLLDSPHYGERWARHWLDVAGYADSDGYTLADADRPWAWKYRDYVTRSFNSDKPFDRFITEQLAGDELAGPAQGDWTAEQIELLTATDSCALRQTVRAAAMIALMPATKSSLIRSRSLVAR